MSYIVRRNTNKIRDNNDDDDNNNNNYNIIIIKVIMNVIMRTKIKK